MFTVKKVLWIIMVALLALSWQGSAQAATKHSPKHRKAKVQYVLAPTVRDHLRQPTTPETERVITGSSVGKLPLEGITVKSTAYNSLAKQTDGDPWKGAGKERFTPTMKIVAMSRDLRRKYGLELGDSVRLKDKHGVLQGRYVVYDVLHQRKSGQIDIWMQTSYSSAMWWGNKRKIQLLPD